MSKQEALHENETMVTRARGSPNEADCMALYDVWAPNYNQDLSPSQGNYVAPSLLAQAVLKASSTHNKSLILDAGCGTGLVGQALAQGGNNTIDGLDLSPAMLKVAGQTGVYRSLATGDLTKRLEKADETYDIVTCCGTFTHGHVGPDPALREFARITKTDGRIFASILEEIWHSGGFEEEVDKLVVEGLVEVVSMDLIDYVMARGDKAVFLILAKTSSL